MLEIKKRWTAVYEDQNRVASHTVHCVLLFYLFIYLFIDREEVRKKERERNIKVWLPLMHPLLETWPATQTCALTGNPTRDPLVHRPVFNPLSHTRQGRLCAS